MHVGWSRIYESFTWDCIWGCHGDDYESTREAQQGFLTHVCRSASDPV